MADKWTVVRSDSIVRDRWIDLRAEDCRTAAGAQISPYYVLHYPDWINVVAITKDERLVLVRQYRHAAGEFFLEIPAGGLEPKDANTEQGARRELLEETGFTAARWQFVSTLYPNPASQTNRVHTYLALDVEPVQAQSLDAGEEGLEIHLMPVADVLLGLRSGLIGQAMHVSSIFLGLTMAGYC